MKRVFNKFCKNNFIRTIFVLIVTCAVFFAAVFSLTLIHTNREVIYAEDDVDKIYFERHVPTVDDDFVDNEIIVTLRRKYSKINGKIDPYIFSTDNIKIASNCERTFANSDEIVIESINDLTSMSNASKIDKDIGFNQILSIMLAEHNKQKVIEAINAFEKLDFVLAAEPNYNYGTVDDWDVPNDPHFSYQWGLSNATGANIENAWANIEENSGTRIKVGIFENSVQSNHPDLNVIPGYFTPSNEGDLAKHGTHVAGIIGAITNNGEGVSGIAQVDIALLQRTSFVESLSWAIDNGIKIVNASFYFTNAETGLPAEPNVAHANAIRMFGENGGLLIASAGNSSANTDNNPQYPVGYGDKRKYPDINNVISVGSLTSGGGRASTSCYGENSVHIYAPGENILSTYPTSVCNNGQCGSDHFSTGYHYMSGTSMSAPHVTGVAALLLSQCSELNGSALKNFILANSDYITIMTSQGEQVVRKLNAYKAIMSLNENASYYCDFVIEEINKRASSATVIGNLSLHYMDGFIFTADEFNTWTQYSADGNNIVEQDKRGFTRWSMCLDGVDGYDPDTNPWIVYTTERTLEFDVYKIINDYYPNYTHGHKIHFRAIYNESTASDNCVSAGTLITLSDGSQKPVEQLTDDDMLLVWNMNTGTFDTAPVLFVDSEPIKNYEVINLYFSDGTNVKVITEHAFWDYDLNKYVYLRKDAAKYIGHWFNKLSIDGSDGYGNVRIQLTNVVVQEEQTSAWSPVTYGHLCYYVNGMLSMPGGISGLINIFDVDAQTLQYDIVAMQNDIATYGLYTYEEFTEIVPVTEDIFNAFNGQYLKVSIGKGLITIEMIQELVARYSKFFNKN